LQATTDVTSRVFRDTMGCFATGVCIVSAKHGDQLHGMTVNSLTSVSLHPPLVLVCFNRNTRTERAVQAAGAFGVNVLREEQADLSNRFARPGEDHYEGLELLYEDGVPLLPNCLAYLVCRTGNVYLEGDHSIVIGHVIRALPGKGAPLLFVRGRYHCLGGAAGTKPEFWYW
jgi:flavin reductase (DIM6/NTAB) family NADH-FMN oxidoreductase RutF